MKNKSRIKIVLGTTFLFGSNLFAQNSNVEVVESYKLKKLTEYRKDTKTFDITEFKFLWYRTNAYDAKKLFQEKFRNRIRNSL